MTTMADLLNQIARERDITLNQLAAYMPVSSSAMHRWAHGQAQPDPRYCWRIAELAGMEIEDVMRLAGHLPPAGEQAVRRAVDPQVLEALEELSPEEQRELALPAIELVQAYLRRGRGGAE